jgi:hypothetical protein
MGIQFDEVVGSVQPGAGDDVKPGPETSADTPATPPVDPDRLRRELLLFYQREARLFAD